MIQPKLRVKPLSLKQALLAGVVATLTPGITFGITFSLLQSAAQAQTFQFPAVQLLAGRPLNASNSSKGGGVRGQCRTGNKVLTALIPEKDPGNTTQAYPTFLFYLPFGKTSFTTVAGADPIEVTSARFVLLDDERNLVFQRQLLLPKQAGLVRFTLPSTAKALEVGKDYRWYFSIVCDATNQSVNPIVDGWLKRVPVDTQLANQLKGARPQDQYSIYQKSNLWYDSLARLVQYRTELAEPWKATLKSFDLQEFSQAPIVELKSDN